jgi:hypothetical protein
MARQNINIGTGTNTKTGEGLRTAFTKVNDNFTELYALANADIQIPSQNGNAGKVLKTTGSSLLFENISYNELTDRPTLFSGSYNDLSNKPLIFSGNYADLSGKPLLSDVATSGNYADLANKPVLASVATSGSYSDLTGKPPFALASVPSSSIGAEGNIGGMIAVDSTYFYYCVQTYDGTNSIWKRIPWDTQW